MKTFLLRCNGRLNMNSGWKRLLPALSSGTELADEIVREINVFEKVFLCMKNNYH